MKKGMLVFVIFVWAAVGWANVMPYGYPIVNPYEATIIGTPSFFRADLPEKVPLKKLNLTVFKDRKIPNVFWYQNKLQCSLAYQKGKAPLIFVIAGTGASYDSSNMQMFQKAFFKAGFHVISLSSPTHPNFVVTASTTQVPGYVEYDARDLYHVMELAWQKVSKRIEVSEFYLTGYSLGATQSAFIAKLDEEKKQFNFKKVLMINPAVSLYKSVQRLDGLLEYIPGGPDNFNSFFDNVMHWFAQVAKKEQHIEFNHDFLFDVYKISPPKESTLEALIGVSFRLSSTNMVFTADVLTHAGYVVPKNRILTSSDSLTEYFKVTARTSFEDYFNGLFYPFFKTRQPKVTRENLIDELSLYHIEDFLKSAAKIGVVTNEDDIILAPEEVEFLRRVFESRAKIYPKGGHCGNMAYKDNVRYMIDFFKN